MLPKSSHSLSYSSVLPSLWRPAACTLVIILSLVWPTKGQVTVVESDSLLEIDNGLVKVAIATDPAGLAQHYYAATDGRWEKALEAFRPPNPRPTNTTPLYLDQSNEHGRALRVADPYRIIVPEVLQTYEIIQQDPDAVVVRLSGETAKMHVEQLVTVRTGEQSVGIAVRGELTDDPPRLEYLLSPFAFAAGGAPDFSHAPSYKRSPGDVIGDRVFFAPTVQVQTGPLSAAIVADVNKINNYPVYAEGARPQKHRWIFGVPIDSSKISLPAVLDLELASGMTTQPLLAYGLMDVIAEQHVFWRHENANGTLVRTLSDNVVQYGLDLLLHADAAPQQGFRQAAAFLWDRYGTHYMQKPRPQAMPFATYANELYPASFGYKGYTVEHPAGDPVMVQRDANGPADWDSWQQFQLGDLPAGGQRLSAPQWFHLAYNTAWWNNVADATGFYFWGHRLGDESLIDKALRVVNLTLSAPQQNGLFPSLYDIENGQWIRSLWRFPSEGYNPNETRNYWDWVDGDYHTAAASVTAGYLMEIHRDYNQDPRILDYVRGYAEFLIEHMAPDGSVPAWYDEHLEARPTMVWNAEGGAHVWVLSELFRATDEVRYRDTAVRAAQFLIDEVLPTQRWVDFEALYSCAVKAETFYDERTGQPPRNAMSMSWAVQGFLSLFETTGEQQYLEAAESVADYASLLQAVWAPHYIITAYPFGGMNSQIGDAEWLDQRDHRFAGIFARVGLLTGRQDLIERGIAAARSSFALVTHPRHVDNGIYNAPTFPFGLGPENIDHEGFPQTPLRSGPSWAEVGGLMAAADVLRHLGGLYINVTDDMAAGVDGLAVRDFELEDRTLTVRTVRLLSELPVPYEAPYPVVLKVQGLPDSGSYQLVLDDQPALELSAAQLAEYTIEIQP